MVSHRTALPIGLECRTPELDREHFTRTDMHKGLTEADVHTAIRMLMNEPC